MHWVAPCISLSLAPSFVKQNSCFQVGTEFNSMKKLRIVGGIAISLAAVSSFGQTSSTRLFELRKNPPVEIQRNFSIGQKESSDLLHLAVSMPFGDPVGAQAYADAVSNPSSPLYRQFLTPAEVGRKFGIPAYRVQKIRDFLSSQGMTVRLVADNHLSILVDATVDQAQKAFHTSIQNFAIPATESEPAAVRFSFTTPPAVPAEIAGDVQDIAGMESFTRPKPHTIVGPLTATQLRAVYGAASLYSGNGKQGAGRTIAISNFDGFALSNVPLEISLMGLPSPSAGAGKNITVEPVDGGTGPTGIAAGEGDLDIQTVLGAAPLCNLIVYDNYQSNQNASNNPIDVLTLESQENKADIISESYGWSFDPATALSAHNLHVTMTTQGITYLVAAGDTGTTWVSQGSNFDYPAIEPEVLLVGGTSVIVNSAGVRQSEIGWNSNGGAGGGGWNVTTDTFNTRPSYQSTATFLKGVGVPSLSSVPYRLVPDVAFDADPTTGYLIYVKGSESQYGGTSGASPTCAGLLAELEEQLINDGALAANSSGKYRLGRIQDLLYSFNGLSSVFYDVTSGTNGTLPNGVQSNAGIGWDTDTGWGPIIFSGLKTQMEQSVFTVSLSPSTVISGAASQGTITLPTAAPSGGTTVTLKSSTSDAVVPASVKVAAGATSTTFSVTTASVNSVTTATITATANKVVETATLTIDPATVAISTISTTVTTLIGGASTVGTVTLTEPAPTGGAVVDLKSSLSNVKVPASVQIAAGASSATFAVSTTAVSSNTNATLTATLGKSTESTTMVLIPLALTQLSLSTPSVVSGSNNTVTGTVTLNGPAPTGGAVVSLKSSLANAKVASSVKVPAGATSATFPVTTTLVTSSKNATITGTYGKSTQVVTLTLNPIVVAAVSLSAPTVVGGSNVVVTGTVTLNSAAGTGGAVIALKSSVTSIATVVASVTVKAGATTGTFTVTDKQVAATNSSFITATLNTITQGANFTVNPFQIVGLTLSPNTVVGGASSTGQVTLNAVPSAKNGSVVVSLKSSLSSVKVPSSVSIAAGASTGTFTIKTSTVKTASTSNITATKGSSSQAQALTIQS